MKVRSAARQVGTCGPFREQRGSGGGVAGEEVLGHGEADAAGGVVILAAVAAVGEVAGDGLAVRLCGGGGVSSGRLDFGEDAPSLPRLGRMAELRLAFDRPEDFLRVLRRSDGASGACLRGCSLRRLLALDWSTCPAACR